MLPRIPSGLHEYVDEKSLDNFTTVKGNNNNKKACYLATSKDQILPAQSGHLFPLAEGEVSGHCVPALHKKGCVRNIKLAAILSVCFRKDAGITLEKISSLSFSFTHTHILEAHIGLCLRANWQPGQSATTNGYINGVKLSYLHRDDARYLLREGSRPCAKAICLLFAHGPDLSRMPRQGGDSSLVVVVMLPRFHNLSSIVLLRIQNGVSVTQNEIYKLERITDYRIN
ncbi:hypothetical protein AVEN_51349-1 [Araneus ventricosus]|uniref:Uncharacterized protein n=1 Tax=Araneus ventricosus TaxID=182803 RepID=A0A4Y2RLR7_ARAVE|nr:hypothetical protein AVEN_51349-1 [Araneus ventricosus]